MCLSANVDYKIRVATFPSTYLIAKHIAFFRTWTCKEVLLKRQETGLAPLDRFEVNIEPSKQRAPGDPSRCGPSKGRDLYAHSIVLPATRPLSRKRANRGIMNPEGERCPRCATVCTLFLGPGISCGLHGIYLLVISSLHDSS